MGLTKSEGGLGVGVGPTSIFFLGAIVATIVYLSIARVEDIDGPELQASVAITLKRQRAMLVYFAAIAAVAVAVLFWAHAQPHAAAAGDEGPAVSVTALGPGQSATINFPTTTVIECRTIVRDTLALVQRGSRQRLRRGSLTLRRCGIRVKPHWKGSTRTPGPSSTVRSIVCSNPCGLPPRIAPLRLTPSLPC